MGDKEIEFPGKREITLVESSTPNEFSEELVHAQSGCGWDIDQSFELNSGVIPSCFVPVIADGGDWEILGTYYIYSWTGSSWANTSALALIGPGYKDGVIKYNSTDPYSGDALIEIEVLILPDSYFNAYANYEVIQNNELNSWGVFVRANSNFTTAYVGIIELDDLKTSLYIDLRKIENYTYYNVANPTYFSSTMGTRIGNGPVTVPLGPNGPYPTPPVILTLTLSAYGDLITFSVQPSYYSSVPAISAIDSSITGSGYIGFGGAFSGTSYVLSAFGSSSGLPYYLCEMTGGITLNSTYQLYFSFTATGGAYLGGEPVVKSNLFIYTSVGGTTISGEAVVSTTGIVNGFIFVFHNGIQTSGVALLTNTFVYIPTGSTTISGEAIVLSSSFSWIGTGGITTGGAALNYQGWGFEIQSAGGVTISGTAHGNSTAYPFTLLYTTQGGVTLSGQAEVASLVNSYNAIGSITVSGHPVVQANYPVVTTGGITASGGTAIASTNNADFTASGGIIISGQAHGNSTGYPFSLLFTSSGGTTLSGTAIATGTAAVIITSGGITISSNTLLQASYVTVTLGGMTTGGTTPIGPQYSFLPSGGTSTGGSATVVPNYNPLYHGAITIDGTANTSSLMVKESEGGITISGVADVTDFYPVSMSGGVAVSGTGMGNNRLYFHTAMGGVTLGGAVDDNSTTYSYLQVYPFSRIFVSGNAIASPDTFSYTGLEQITISGSSIPEFCVLNCAADPVYYREFEKNPGCQLTTGSGTQLTCARMIYVYPTSTIPMKQTKGAYVPAVTVCRNQLFTTPYRQGNCLPKT